MQFYEYEDDILEVNVPRDERRIHMRDIARFEVELEESQTMALNITEEDIDDERYIDFLWNDTCDLVN